MRKIYVSSYEFITWKNRPKTVDLLSWLTEKKTAQIHILEQIRAGGLSKKEIDNLKLKLSVITPSGIFSERKVKGLLKHSNVICLDFDKIKDNLMTIKEIICQNKSVFYCGISASGNGLYAMVLIENSAMHKQHFNALVELYAKLGIEVDKQCSDVSRARFYAYDQDAYINKNAIPYTNFIEATNIIQTSKTNKMKKVKNITEEVKVTAVETQRTERSFENMILDSNFEDEYILVKPKNTSGAKIKELIKIIIQQRVDITREYNDWLKIAGIINNNFPEEGRDLFHAISSFYPNYSFAQADRFYTSCQKHRYKNQEFFSIAEKNGIYLED